MNKVIKNGVLAMTLASSIALYPSDALGFTISTSNKGAIANQSLGGSNNNTSLKGDLNGDGKITLSDVSILQMYLNGTSSSIDSNLADLNNNGYIDKDDLAILLQIQMQQKYIEYQVNIEGTWIKTVRNGNIGGTTGQSKKMKGISIGIPGVLANSTDIQYHVYQSGGWSSWVGAGNISGNHIGTAPIEAIEIKLGGIYANQYDVYYRVHSSDFGWQGWTRNGAAAGSIGYNKQVEAIQIMLVPKGISHAYEPDNAFKEKKQNTPISTAAMTQQQYQVTANGSLRLRSNPSTSASIVGKMPNGTVVTGSNQGNGWIKVNYNGNVGYASNQYLREYIYTDGDYYNPLGQYKTFYGAPTPHDFGIATGTPVYAICDGDAYFYQIMGTYNGIYSTVSYGNYIVLKNGSLEARYGHLSAFNNVNLKYNSRQLNGSTYKACKNYSKQLIEKRTVKKGEVIGYVGSTGNSTAPHLHFELYVNNARKNINSFFK